MFRSKSKRGCGRTPSARRPDAGLEEWIRAWIDRFGDRLVRYVYVLTGDRALAEDVAQDVFLRLYVHHGLHPERAVSPAWLFTVAKNRTVDLARARKRTVVLPEHWEETANLPDMEEQVAVRDVLGRLAAQDRECLYLFYYSGLSTSEIARHLRIAPGAVRSRLMRARKRFQTLWEGGRDARIR